MLSDGSQNSAEQQSKRIRKYGHKLKDV